MTMVGSFRDCENVDEDVDIVLFSNPPSPSDAVTGVVTANVCSAAIPTAVPVPSADSWGGLCEPAPALPS